MTTYNATQRRRTRHNETRYDTTRLDSTLLFNIFSTQDLTRETSTQANKGALSDDIPGRIVVQRGQVRLATRRLRVLALLGLPARRRTSGGRPGRTRRLRRIRRVCVVGRRRRWLLERASIPELSIYGKERRREGSAWQRRSDTGKRQTSPTCGNVAKVLTRRLRLKTLAARSCSV